MGFTCDVSLIIFSFKQRTFYISTYWGGCPADVGYLVISTEAPDGTWTTCSFDNHADYPTITYAAGDTGGAVFDSTGIVIMILINEPPRKKSGLRDLRPLTNGPEG